MATAREFVDDLEHEIAAQLSALDLLKETEIAVNDRSDVVRRLKIALKNELEASELAAVWIPSTPELDVKLALARQAGDEARHYRMIEKRLQEMDVDLGDFDPAAGGYGPMFQLLCGLSSTVERAAAAGMTREALAHTKNEQFIEFCEAAGDTETAALYRNEIQPDEQWHVAMGRGILERYATTAELQEKARRAAQAVLDLAMKIQRKQLEEMKVSHAPGC
ncbi:MAG TPA: ferritin-like domain-containing protein [Terriglobia bacterium]|nr:ferritin-like domain-containing protein [Terriglobia bacterium]